MRNQFYSSDSRLTFIRTLPTISAAIILLSLPLDGLFQRVVSYPVTAVPDPTKPLATISRTILYDPKPQDTWRNGSDALSQDLLLDASLISFWQENSLLEVDFECGTGECTYDPFYTLALDIQCKPISNLLEFGC